MSDHKTIILTLALTLFLGGCRGSKPEQSVATEFAPGGSSSALALIKITKNKFSWSGMEVGMHGNGMTRSQVEEIVGPINLSATGWRHMNYCRGQLHGDVIYLGYKLHLAFDSDTHDSHLVFMRIGISPEKQDRSFDQMKHEAETKFRGAWAVYPPDGGENALYTVNPRGGFFDVRHAIYLDTNGISLFDPLYD